MTTGGKPGSMSWILQSGDSKPYATSEESGAMKLRRKFRGVTLGSSSLSGSNSVVESRLPKPLVAGSIPVSRSTSLKRSRSWKVYFSCKAFMPSIGRLF